MGTRGRSLQGPSCMSEPSFWASRPQSKEKPPCTCICTFDPAPAVPQPALLLAPGLHGIPVAASQQRMKQLEREAQAKHDSLAQEEAKAILEAVQQVYAKK